MINRLLDDDLPSAIVGFYQALGVVTYTSLVAGLMFYFENNLESEPGYIGVVLFLTLFVFSAGLTATLVFGLPVYFALKNHIRRSIAILAYTFLFILLALVTALLAILTLS